MNSDPNKRQVRIFNAKTGEVRLSEPIPEHLPRQAASDAVPAAPAANALAAAADTPSAHSAPPDAPAASGTTQRVTEAEATPVPDDTVVPGDGAGPTPKGKPKTEIQTLEQFIEYAYGRKGQPVTLKAKTERLIALNPRLDEEAKGRLAALADADQLLAVPRQLLMLSREIEGLPALRAALISFVSTVMLRHPAFADPGVQAALRNLPEAPGAAEALATVAAHTPAQVEGKDPLKRSDLQALRRNAAHLLATWFAANRGLNTEELAALLLQAMWAPAARELADDNERLRALTEIEQPAGVGLACQRFRQQATDARAAQDQAQREVAALREQVAELGEQCQRAEAEREELRAAIAALRERVAEELAELRHQHEVERTHLRHEHEQLRGRLVRRLEESREMLEVGLTALRNKTPRTEVMVERAEHVVDALRTEAINLKEQ